MHIEIFLTVKFIFSAWSRSGNFRGIELLYQRFAILPFLCILRRTTRTNNAMPLDFESRTGPSWKRLKISGLARKFGSGMRGYPTRLSWVARGSSDRGSGYTRSSRVLRTEHSGPVPVSHRNPFPRDMIHCCTRLGDHPAVCSEILVEESPRSIRRRAPTLARRLAMNDALSGADWTPRSNGLGELLHIDLSTLIDLCIAWTPLERQPLQSYITRHYAIWSDKDFFVPRSITINNVDVEWNVRKDCDETCNHFSCIFFKTFSNTRSIDNYVYA